jgi:hypothetical protein
MTREEAKAAAIRLLEWTAFDYVITDDDSIRKSDDIATLAEWSLARIAADEAAPQWHDKPTCAGLWLFDEMCGVTAIDVSFEAVSSGMFTGPCFGPMPERRET